MEKKRVNVLITNETIAELKSRAQIEGLGYQEYAGNLLEDVINSEGEKDETSTKKRFKKTST